MLCLSFGGNYTDFHSVVLENMGYLRCAALRLSLFSMMARPIRAVV